MKRISPALLLVIALTNRAPAETWKAGVAQVKITPDTPMWMSGYSSRTSPAEGTLIDLWAKALVLEDPAGRRAALVTLDLVGIHRDLSLMVRDALEETYGLQRSQVAIACSHTHCGPVVGHNLMAMYLLDDAQRGLVEEYSVSLEKKLVGLVGEAIGKLAPGQIAWGNGQATFAVNRRDNKEPDVPKLREAGRLVGPVDYDVPVLAIRDGEGRLTAVVFGYACHATVMSFMRWSGDYPGFAQLDLEGAHPGAVALFWAGCGGDQNPLPRSELMRAKQYGAQLAEAVERTLAGVMTPLAGELATAYREVDLPFDRLPTRDELEQRAKSSNPYEVRRATPLLAQLDAGRPLSPTYPYPVQLWRLGSDLLFVTLGGEVVVDYALRLKAELGRERTWVAAYTNDVMAYIPSRRVLAEGGYEGGGAMVYYGLPAIWGPEVEALIVKQVHSHAHAVGAERSTAHLCKPVP
ncbi:MAG TPA: neutral/alkaline non-lysosomal ceramidase N-terminal domain-containing protein [Pirellulales bacterium]|nr:neutral/alkaline non-lysosomal ceramidase N-terminal domain-containing protein [Pirellulales bacterium]